MQFQRCDNRGPIGRDARQEVVGSNPFIVRFVLLSDGHAFMIAMLFSPQARPPVL